MISIGDRVSRHVGLGEPRRYGVVVDVYKGRPTTVGVGFTQYKIKWDDDGSTTIGHLEISLQKEEK